MAALALDLTGEVASEEVGFERLEAVHILLFVLILGRDRSPFHVSKLPVKVANATPCL